MDSAAPADAPEHTEAAPSAKEGAPEKKAIKGMSGNGKDKA